MEQFSLFQPKNVLKVSQLTTYLRQLLEDDPILQDVWVEGEISNFAQPSSGHLYFTLKDGDAAIRCVMWRNAAQRMNFAPREGLAVQAHGSMGIYETSGQVQLYVDTMTPAGEGALFQEFLRLKAKLEAEGLFEEELKRQSPWLPKVIGIVTSPTGAALQDMLNTITRRYPVAEVVLSPTPVQGIDAPAGIVAALERLNREVAPDVILIGRGGGSIEDLWAFNDEAVARAVAASEAPIISGVGHETDFTLTDFAADRRAPTPTAAAELATPDRLELMGVIADLQNRQQTQLRESLVVLGWEVAEWTNKLERHSPLYRVDNFRQRLDEVQLRLDRSMQSRLKQTQLTLAHLTQSLRSLNPMAVLKRGYAIVTREEDGQVIKDTSQAAVDENIHVRVSQGSLSARISKINPGGS
ncbi:MAG: exodeoxyribonuclease VII large subunit [Anaerolineaceae bacterium]|nr:exodeoxyribonuclease VII large subunit [Anaerolineaceae bacterium]